MAHIVHFNLYHRGPNQFATLPPIQSLRSPRKQQDFPPIATCQPGEGQNSLRSSVKVLPYIRAAVACKLCNNSLFEREAAEWMISMSWLESSGFLKPSRASCWGKPANQRDKTLLRLLKKEGKISWRKKKKRQNNKKPQKYLFPFLTKLLLFLLSGSNWNNCTDQSYLS